MPLNTQTSIGFTTTDPSDKDNVQQHDNSQIIHNDALLEYNDRIYEVMRNLNFGTYKIENLVEPQNRRKFIYLLKLFMDRKVFQEYEGFELDLDDSQNPQKITKKSNTYYLVKQ